LIETDQVKPQKVRIALGIVVLTEMPEFWRGLKEYLAEKLPERAADIEAVRGHTFGIPIDKEGPNPVRIEFEETEVPPKETDVP
jgi:hypothetical protein